MAQIARSQMRTRPNEILKSIKIVSIVAKNSDQDPQLAAVKLITDNSSIEQLYLSELTSDKLILKKK